MKLTSGSTVRELVVEYPQTRDVLESFGIDYCCGGGRALADAAHAAGADTATVLTALRTVIANPCSAKRAGERSWRDATLTELVQHIEDTHHVFMKEALPRLSRLLGKVRAVHADKHGDMLGQLHRVFSSLRVEIEMHLMKEEQVLFPYIRQMEAALEEGGAVPPMHCETVRNPIGQMEHEHDNAGKALAAMRRLTEDYSLPDDACASFKALFDGLRELESDLHEHIHLENNILFPHAVKMEAENDS